MIKILVHASTLTLEQCGCCWAARTCTTDDYCRCCSHYSHSSASSKEGQGLSALLCDTHVALLPPWQHSKCASHFASTHLLTGGMIIIFSL